MLDSSVSKHVDSLPLFSCCLQNILSENNPICDISTTLSVFIVVSILGMEFQKERFYEHLYERRKNVAENNRGLTLEKYSALIEEVKSAKVAEKKTPRMHWLLKHYDVLSIQSLDKLIVPLNNQSVDVIYYVHDDELFNTLQEIHISTGHGGRDRMMKKIKEKYKNIVRTDILLFINLCAPCQMKQKREKKGIVSKPMIFNDLNSRCQVDLIDYQSHADGKYKFVLVYQDHLTKFVILRPLETKRAEEVAYHLVDIFTIFGAPVVLQSDNGREFCNRVIEELKTMWPELKLVHGKPRHSQSQGSVERAKQDVENMLTTWMLENKTEHWSEGLRFIQFMKNTSLHSGIKRSPYEAIYGGKPKVGLKTSNIPLEAIDSVTTEEDLENVIISIHADIADNAEMEQSHQSEIEIVTETEEVIEEQLEGVLAENHDNGQEISYPICSTCFNPVNEEGFDVGKPCSENICSFCTRNRNIAMARKAAHDGLELQAKRMRVISDSTHPKPKIESTVRIPVPDVDRGRGDARSVLAVVLEATEDGFYRLGTKEGVISKYYSRSEFIPPSSVQVSDDWGPVKNGLTTSYAEGASLTLTCVATAGKPLARVSWWRDGELITDETQYLPDRRRSQSVLRVEKLLRSHLLAVYSCESSNSRLQPPLVVRVAIDMYLRPLDVSLLGDNPEYSAGKRYNVTCRCRGSRPPAIITWWKDGVSLEGGIVTVSADGNTTTSTLSFTPTSADHGLILTCKASNQRIPFSEQQRTWMLKVLYPPKVTLTLGHGLDANDIKEGADVYFECHLIANPWVHRVWWLRDGDRLLSNATAGVIVSNQTLVLQGVSRASSGRYCCEATNKEGTSRSPPFHLRVKFEPICGDGAARRVLGAAKDEPLRVECKVEAEPVATTFRWSFNSTPGISKDLNEFTTEANGISVLTYIPRVAADYGTLQCWGKNAIGVQIIPCTYHIVPAGRPDPPHTCGVTNITHHSVLLTCKKGFDGGLRQKFVLVLNLGENTVANVSSSSPDFNISNLDPSQDYTATVSSVNSKGASKIAQPVLFHTLPAPGLKEQRRSTEPSTNETLKVTTGPWLYIILAAGSTLIVAAAVGAIIFAVRRFKVESPVRNAQIRSPKMEESPLTPHVPALYTDAISDENNPDLIPDAPNNEALLDGSLVPPYTISSLARPTASKRDFASQLPIKPYHKPSYHHPHPHHHHVTWAPSVATAGSAPACPSPTSSCQSSRNCATQTPPPHKESSV